MASAALPKAFQKMTTRALPLPASAPSSQITIVWGQDGKTLPNGQNVMPAYEVILTCQDLRIPISQWTPVYYVTNVIGTNKVSFLPPPTTHYFIIQSIYTNSP